MQGVSILSNRRENTTIIRKEYADYDYDCLVLKLELLIKYKDDNSLAIVQVTRPQISRLMLLCTIAP